MSRELHPSLHLPPPWPGAQVIIGRWKQPGIWRADLPLTDQMTFEPAIFIKPGWVWTERDGLVEACHLGIDLTHGPTRREAEHRLCLATGRPARGMDSIEAIEQACADFIAAGGQWLTDEEEEAWA